MFGHRGGIGRYHDFMRAESESVSDLGGRAGEEDDMGTKGPGEFNTQVAETTEADHADFLAGPHLPMAQRGVGRDAGAQQGRGGGEIEALGYMQGEGLVDDDGGGVTSEGVPAEVLIGAVVGEGRPREAELLQTLLATRASTTGIDHAARGTDVAHLEFRDLGADRGHTADDLVTGDAGVARAGPFTAGRMHIGMADAAEENFHFDVSRAGFAANNLHLSERVGGGGGAEGLGGGGHGALEERGCRIGD